jgi:hypothetical protein
MNSSGDASTEPTRGDAPESRKQRTHSSTPTPVLFRSNLYIHHNILYVTEREQPCEQFANPFESETGVVCFYVRLERAFVRFLCRAHAFLRFAPFAPQVSGRFHAHRRFACCQTLDGMKSNVGMISVGRVSIRTGRSRQLQLLA